MQSVQYWCQVRHRVINLLQFRQSNLIGQMKAISKASGDFLKSLAHLVTMILHLWRNKLSNKDSPAPCVKLTVFKAAESLRLGQTVLTHLICTALWTKKRTQRRNLTVFYLRNISKLDRTLRSYFTTIIRKCNSRVRHANKAIKMESKTIV